MLHEGVQTLDVVVHLGQQTAALDLGRQQFTREHIADAATTIDVVTEQTCHARVAIELMIGVHVAKDGLFSVRRYAHRRQHDTRSQRAFVFRGQAAVIRFTNAVKLHPRVRGVEVIFTNPENFRQLGKVQRHHLRLGRTAKQEHQPVNVFDRSERFLPHFKRRSRLQLFETHFHVEILRLG